VQVTLLGTGTLVPEAGLGSTSLLVHGDDYVLPVDLGRGALSRIVEAGYDPLALDRYLFTHLHADHTAELGSLLFALRHGRTTREAVELIGPRGLRDFVGRVCAAWPSASPDFDLRITETDGGIVPSSGPVVRAVAVHHGDHSALGFRFEDPRSGRACAFTGDTGPGPRRQELARGVDLLVAECGDGLVPGRGRHLDVDSLVALVDGAGVGRVAVIHVDPRHGRRAVMAALRDRLGERLVAGTDGLEIAV